MASNATFEVEIYGNTTKFENSLKGVNTAMSGLRGEAKNLREALKLDPTNTGKMAQLQKNLQTQLGLSRDKATKLKEELSTVDKSSPAGQKKWLQLTRDLGTAETQANRLESEIKQVEGAISSGSWNIEAKMDTKGVNSGIEGMKSRFSGLREIAVGVFRQIGSSAVSAVGNGLKGWVSDAMDTQKAMISLQNTMKFKGNGQDFDYVSKSMQNLAKDTNANTEDTLKLSTTFIGLGDTAKKAVGKTEALVKANQAFGGTGENLKGVVQSYGQMSAAGKVTAENIGQLTDNNTALGSSLKDTIMKMNPSLQQYGSFNDAVSEGAVSMGMLDKAMDKMAKGSGGGVKTIGDAWDSFNETMSIALVPTLNALTPIISSLIDQMSDWGESAGKSVSNVVKYFQDLFQKLQENAATLAFLEAWDNIKSAFDSIVSIIANVINSFLGINKETTKNATSIDNVAKSIAVFAGKFSEVTKKIADFLKKISESKSAMDTLKGTLVVLASAFVALKVINGIIKAFEIYNKIVKAGTIIQGAFNAIMAINPFVALGIAIAAIVAGLVYFFTQTETGKKAWSSFVDFLKSSWDGIVTFFSGIGQWFADIWNGAVDGAKGIWQGLVDWFSGVVQGIQNIWNGIITFFTTLWTTVVTGIQTAWAGVTGFFTGLWNGIVNIVTTVFTTIASLVTGAYNWFVTTFQPLISFYQSIFNLIGSIINLAFQLILAIIRGAYQLVIGAWQGISGFFGGIFNAVSSVVSTVFSAIGSFAVSAWNVLVGVWNAVAGFFGGIFNAVRGIVSSVFSAIGSFASSSWIVVQSIWSAVSGFFSGIFNSVRGVVGGVFSAIGGFASNAWSIISGVFSGVGSFFSGVFNGAKNAVSGVFSAFGGFASNAYNAITGVFKGLGSFFSGIFGGIKDTIDSVLGGVTGTINGISKAVNGIAGKLGGLFKGSMVVSLPEVNMASSGYGLSTNSVSSDNRTYNTFHVQGGAGQDVSNLARAIRREFDLGRA
ncbi:tape measure protein [Lactococcus phage ASCC465]|uniref:Tape measure protein n=8 Tax=Skunavirus TaxID=1623305 RepID=H9EEN8_9CAUD|nr:tail length tape measure protein [Lactococcus phage ASCC465]YP_006201948.1 tail length tape measure protein [Lactococcus phage ASCC281]AFE86640.1 tape measure protein [Lactococcus phage ASCC473]AFE86697.1 tape measure protein [Lactococcus phage ASCC489]AFE87265.1 tape measure protein [Lactococcus phage ASCC358]AFE87322.1 tape measure protein [Lactococcus phage ASCC365]AFE87789.1 tape measure protein [Lactococcus phage ASCC497]AFE88019.1 tape measure protein [Lactococcus phage ASCC531]